MHFFGYFFEVSPTTIKLLDVDVVTMLNEFVLLTHPLGRSSVERFITSEKKIKVKNEMEKLG